MITVQYIGCDLYRIFINDKELVLSKDEIKEIVNFFIEEVEIIDGII